MLWIAQPTTDDPQGLVAPRATFPASALPLMLILTLALGAARPATAQDGGSAGADDPWAGVEEMIVQGTGTEGLLATAGTSMTAFDAGELEAIGASDVSDLAQFTPNLEIKTAGATSATLFIRGIGLNDFTANGSGAVAVYQDDVPLNLPAIQLGQLFDVNEVQVLKGPIGTGPARNASAGAIKIYANKPTGSLGAALRFDYGNYDFKDAEGYLEAPILPDTLSTRVAFRFTERDGLMRNRCADLSGTDLTVGTGCGKLPEQVIPDGLAKNINDRFSWAVRNITRFEPDLADLDTTWLLGLNLSRIDQYGTVGTPIGAQEGVLGIADQSGYKASEVAEEEAAFLANLPPRPPGSTCRRFPDTPGCDSRQIAQDALARRLTRRPVDAEPFVGDFNTDGYERQSTWGGFLRGEWTTGAATFTSITGYQFYDREREVDADYGANQLLQFVTDDNAWQTTQEFRAGGELETLPISWEVGSYALFEELDFQQLTLPPVRTGVFSIDQAFEQKTQSAAAYGELVWAFMDGFELEVGARYNWERKQIDADVILEKTIPICQNRTIGERTGSLVCKQTETFDHPTGVVKLTYFISSDISVSAKFTHGWKGAQFNVRDGTVQSLATDIASPEKLDAFEWGFKGSWFDGRASLRGALFWYDYQDYQVFAFTNNVGTPPQRIVVNADDAQLYGAEVEARAEPLDGLVFDLRFGWIESKFLNFTQIQRRRVSASDDAPGSIIQITNEWDGNRLPNTPRYTVNFAVEYTLEIGLLGSLTPRYDMAWTDDVFFDQSEGRGEIGLAGRAFPDFTIGQKAFALHNFRLTYRPVNEHMEISGWVRNLTNELYKTTAFNASQGARIIGTFLGDPRTYGLSVTAKF